MIADASLAVIQWVQYDQSMGALRELSDWKIWIPILFHSTDSKIQLAHETTLMHLLEGIHTQAWAVPGNKCQSFDLGQTTVAIAICIKVKGRTLHSKVRGRGVARLRVIHLHWLQTVHLRLIHRGGRNHTHPVFTAYVLSGGVATCK